MNLFLAFVVWLVSSTSAVVIADSIVNGISTDKDPVGNPSEDEAIKLGDGIGSEWIASPCGGDVIVNPAKLRARREPCDPHKSPDTPTTGNIKIPIPEDNDNGYGNGDRGILKKYPPYKDFLYIAPSNRAPPLGPTEYRRCPQSGGTTAPDGYMYLICHVGPASDLHIVWVENTMNWAEDIDCPGERFCCNSFIGEGIFSIFWHFEMGDAYGCVQIEDLGPLTIPPGFGF